MLENLTDEAIAFMTEKFIHGMYTNEKDSLHYKWNYRIAMELLEETIKRKKLDPCNKILEKYTPKLIAEFMEAKLKTAPECKKA